MSTTGEPSSRGKGIQYVSASLSPGRYQVRPRAPRQLFRAQRKIVYQYPAENTTRMQAEDSWWSLSKLETSAKYP
jgi:hypothetical protein